MDLSLYWTKPESNWPKPSDKYFNHHRGNPWYDIEHNKPVKDFKLTFDLVKAGDWTDEGEYLSIHMNQNGTWA